MVDIRLLLTMAAMFAGVVAYVVRMGSALRRAQEDISKMKSFAEACAEHQTQRYEDAKEVILKTKQELKDLINELLVEVRLVQQKVDGLNGHGG